MRCTHKLHGTVKLCTVNACIYREESTPAKAHFSLDFTLEVLTFLAPTAPLATLLAVAELPTTLLVVAELPTTLLVVAELLGNLVEVREPVLVLPSL